MVPYCRYLRYHGTSKYLVPWYQYRSTAVGTSKYWYRGTVGATGTYGTYGTVSYGTYGTVLDHSGAGC